jgi:hypothetical protein
MSMSKSELLGSGQGFFGSKFIRGAAASGLQPLESFIATGLGSRGGPNKASNKLRSRPESYRPAEAAAPEYFLATGLGSRGGPNKASNKLRSRPEAYQFH